MPTPSEKVVGLADRIAALPPEEIKQIAPALLLRLNQPAPQAISGQGFSVGSQGAPGAGAAKSEEKKAEKTVFDVKLEKFEAAAKIKIIKEIRTFTDLGLKDAKELVEKAPVILKQSLTKEEAEAIIAKIKTAGGVAVME
jgi:large subunit ribosomal protein L7/L12